MNKTTLMLIAMAVLGGAATAQAQETGGSDGKSYTGTFCRPALSTSAHTLTNLGYGATAAHTAVCPIIKDNWNATSGLSYAYVRVINPAGKTTTCTIYSQNYLGTTIASTSASTTASGDQTIYISPYPSPNAVEGAYIMACSLPAGGVVRRYVAQEKP